jgi:hypothetical protein
MKWTRANVENYAKKMGLQLIQIDSIPEGFSFVGDEIRIGGVTYPGKYVGFIPLEDEMIEASSEDSLKFYYNKAKKKYGQK